MASESMGITEALAHVETFIGGTPAAALGDFLTVLRRAEIKGTAEYFGEYPERWKLVREGAAPIRAATLFLGVRRDRQ